MAKYIKEKNIKAEMTSSGVYVETITPGTGNPVNGCTGGWNCCYCKR